MKRELQRKYLLDHYRHDLFLKYHRIRQNQLTVEEYVAEFEQLSLKCDLVEPEENTIVRFLGGLNPSIVNVVQLQPYWTFQDVVSLALKVEKQQRFGKSGPTRVISRDPAEEKAESKKNPPTTTNNKEGDRQASSSRSPSGSTSYPARKCFKCQGFGHIASGCPNRRVITLMEEQDQEVEEVTEPEVNNQDEFKTATTIIPPDDGPLLVLRRLLNSHKKEPLQRHSLFKTRCTVNGRVCQLIIDSGSCENVASTTLIERLNLPTEEHLNPYKLSWIQKGNEVEVSKRCLIHFSIGKFEEEDWCDVVPMDACHLLLGRPWQYDRKSIHDGAANTCSFIHKGEQMTLLPLEDSYPYCKNGLLVLK
ncbi:uncharacterized protein LOC114581220 [Dendrobium catenatum]|uniref:uncharacterized protein LOC114581220 n=1 Tax=Dendrobium catenatum TaxID=906689 RepID=UPI00109F89BB|nr:uncharacterized protein LOC114581220 [Dendrobium catenatum]